MKKDSLLDTKNVLSIEEFLKLDKQFEVYHKNILSLAIKICNVKNNLSTRIINNVSKVRSVSHNSSYAIILLCQEHI